MTNLSRKYNTYRLSSFFGSEIFTTNPTIVEYILKTNFQNYGKVISYYSFSFFKKLDKCISFSSNSHSISSYISM
ncbi:hypothetical protein Patl1_19993 [Pistacia atlantica]|uniref:Uncharacterized protein n=1 Tax=Pistacia atlantica TaxID=434234 RepID=A0ACC1BIR8_9ROSI|nr:hypothetical protein Patl1_19993 [Pistacia atlantica]